MDKKWSEMSPEEKRAKRFEGWLSPPDVKFPSVGAKRTYQQKVGRLINVLQVKEPDRVPVMLSGGLFPAYYAGVTPQHLIYNYSEIYRVWQKFLPDFDLDTYNSPFGVIPGRVYELIDYKQYLWQGHGVSADAETYQYVEGEYMKADEYDALIQDPSDFMMRTMMPRIFGSLEPLKKLKPFISVVELPIDYFVPYADPEVQGALQSLIDAGKEFSKWLKVFKDCGKLALDSGIPSLGGGGARAPFDRIGDTLRGMKGIIMDMYRQPDKLMEAMEAVTPLIIKEAIASVNASGGVMVHFPLHKGADGFMSAKQFEKFYWPTLKKCVLAFRDEGIMSTLFAEGSYMARLDMVKDLPKGWVLWHFDQMDMAKAKEAVGGTACIAGNVPLSLLYTGTPREVKEHCRKLIEVCGKNGGYILTSGAGIGKVNPDNIKAMIEAAKEYGVYK